MSSRFCSRIHQALKGPLARPFGESFDHNTMHIEDFKRLSKVCMCTVKYKDKEHRRINYTASSPSFIWILLSPRGSWVSETEKRRPLYTVCRQVCGWGGPSWKYVSLWLPPTPSLSSTPRTRNHRLTVKCNYILPLAYLRWERVKIPVRIHEKIHIKKNKEVP